MKYNIIPIILLFVFISGCTQSLNTEQMNYNIKECSESEQIENNIELTGKDNKIEWEQIHNTYCNAKDYIEIKLEKGSNNNITIREIVDMRDDIAGCICPFEITGTIDNLNQGTYTLTYVSENKLFNKERQLKKYSLTVKNKNQPIEIEEIPDDTSRNI